MKILTLLPMLVSLTVGASEFNIAGKAGRDLGKWTRKEAFDYGKEINPEDFVPLSQRGEIFDPGLAKARALAEERPNSETLDYLESEAVARNEKRVHLDEHDPLFANADAAISQAESDRLGDPSEASESAVEEHLEHCLESEGPTEIKLSRTLHVDLHRKPAVVGEVRRCKGHEIVEWHAWFKRAMKVRDRFSNDLENDSSVKEYTTAIQEGQKAFKYKVQANYTHHDNCEICDAYETEIEILEEEKLEELDHWEFDNEKLWSLSSTPNFTLADRRCTDDEPTHIIEGKEVTRKCWKEELTFFHDSAEKPSLNPLWHDPLCKHTSKKCLKEGPLGCALWEHSFRCQRTRSTVAVGQIGLSDAIELDDEDVEGASSTSLPDAVTKLAVFSDMKGEIEGSQAIDPSSIRFFKGAPFTCSKSVTTDLLYDCCFSHAGLANKINLSHCNADELALADRRERKLCRYVGKYTDDFLGLWKSKDVHVFCCFSSKLARALQEGARDQLGRGWGSPEHPDCGGLSQEEITSLDLSTVDLSDAYELPASSRGEDFTDRMEGLAERVRERVQSLQGEGSHAGI